MMPMPSLSIEIETIDFAGMRSSLRFRTNVTI